MSGLIPGAALSANLDRQGTDLSITSNGGHIAHFSTSNLSVGIRTETPQAELHVVGNVIANNASFTSNVSAAAIYDNGNRVMTNTSNLVVTGDVTGSGTYSNIALYLIDTGVSAGTYGSSTTIPQFRVDANGRLTHAGNLTLTQAGNLSINGSTITSPTGNINFSGAVLSNIGTPLVGTDAVNQTFLANALANLNTIEQGTSNVIVLDNGTIRSIKFNVGNVTYGTVSNVGTTLGNVNINNNTITSLNSTVLFGGTGAIGVPVGNTASRPVTPSTGFVRFNSDNSQFEVFNGSTWNQLQNTITDQQITPDGVHSSFTLIGNATTVGTLVSVNGTVQMPGTAYSISGNVITFAETPLVTDIVDVRAIGSATTISSMTGPAGNSSVMLDGNGLHVTTNNIESWDINNNGALVSGLTQISIPVHAVVTTLDSFAMSSYRSAKYIIQASTASSAESVEVLVIHNGVNAAYQNVYAVVNTSGTTTPILGSITSTVSSGNVVISYTAAANATNLRITKVYLPL